jgi:hypothetical protein
LIFGVIRMWEMTNGNIKKSKLGWGPLAAASLLLANIIVPLVWGDVYPFTSAPMFRDNPQHCCNYRVLGPDGEELPAEDWLCHRIYDGNPVGYGVGIKPPPILEREFGHVSSEDDIRTHATALMRRADNLGLDRVEIVQEIIGSLPDDPERVGIVETRRFTIARP